MCSLQRHLQAGSAEAFVALRHLVVIVIAA
jgi:hypothetical protein